MICSVRSRLLATMSLLLASLAVAPAFAGNVLPTGGSVTSGSVTISQPNTTTLNVSNTTLAMTGDQYRVIARNGGGNTTSTTALLTVTTPLPIFSTQPANQAVATGANATFTVLANGNATYQWQREAFGNLTYANLTNTGAYSNVTTATLTVTNSTLVMSGDQFRAVATNVGGSTTSTSALLTVATPLPIFTTEPTSQTVPPGTNVTFTATAGGNATYQWQREAFGNLTYANLTNTGAYSNVTGTTLSVTNVTLAMSGDQFQLVATNLGGSATSTSALLTVQGSVTPLPVFTTQPVNQSITTGSNTSFTAAAGNSTYQWQELVAGNLTYANVTDSATFGGSNTTTLTITNATLALTGDQFRAVATNLGGNTTSTSALLTVTTNLPVFTTQPVNAIEVAGANATFTATAGANATYQWQLQPFGNLTYANLTNTGAYSNVTGTTLTVSNTTLVMSGDQFQLVATNGNGSTTSTSASLTVTTPLPIFTTQPADEAVIAGANTTFTAVTSGNATYQWQREAFGNLTYANLTNTGAYSNVTGTTLSVTNTTLPMDGDQFRAVATNLGGSTTSTSALLTVIIPIPMFTGQPANKTVVKGANTTFGVVATNGIDFQWQVLAPGSAGYANVTDNGTYSGATTKTLTVSNTTLAQSGTRFRAVAANDSGAVTSNAAVLTVNSSLVPVILTQPLSVNALTTSPVKFAIAVGGPRPITFVWEKNNVKLKNSGHIYQATTATLLIRNVVRGDAGNYRVIVTNKNGSVTSQVARLTIFIPTLEIVLSPVSATVKTGASVNFRVIANGLGMLDYLWKKNGVEIRNGGNVSGATTDILRLKNIDAADTGGYRAVVNNGQSTATSNSAMLTVNAAAD